MTWLESWADMTLLDFSRGPAMKVAMFVFVLGCVWRLLGIALLRGRAIFQRRATPTSGRGCG